MTSKSNAGTTKGECHDRPQNRTGRRRRRRPPRRAAPALAADDLKLPRERVELVTPPFVHPHEQATKSGPKIVEFKLTIREKEVVIDDAGTKFQAMTFDGSMPGPMMVLHEGDYMELTLVNPETNTMPHNIDLHSATGGLGGGALTHVNPGEQVALRWKATRAGVFVYHCAPEDIFPGTSCPACTAR